MNHSNEIIWSSLENMMEVLLANEDTCGSGLSEFYTLSSFSQHYNNLSNMACCLQTVIHKINSNNNEHTLWAVGAIYNLSFAHNSKTILQHNDACLINLAKASTKRNPDEIPTIDSCKEYAVCALSNLLNTHTIRQHFCELQNGRWAFIIDSLVSTPPPPVPPNPPEPPSIDI